jgi:hypothetical protein
VAPAVANGECLSAGPGRLEPDPAGFKAIASAQLFASGENGAPIALGDGKLLIRDQKQMKCLQVAQQVK